MSERSNRRLQGAPPVAWAGSATKWSDQPPSSTLFGTFVCTKVHYYIKMQKILNVLQSHILSKNFQKTTREYDKIRAYNMVEYL
jgi:hypothetical protein